MGEPLAFIEPTLYQRGVGVVLGVAMIWITVKLIRQFRLKEEHALPWLIGGVGIILFCLFMPLLKLFTWALGAGTPTTALFAASILFLLVQNLIYASALSRQKRQIQDLALTLALQQSNAGKARDKKHDEVGKDDTTESS
jgi:hypothetical protein